MSAHLLFELLTPLVLAPIRLKHEPEAERFPAAVSDKDGPVPVNA